jgi:hypothetical protein
MQNMDCNLQISTADNATKIRIWYVKYKSPGYDAVLNYQIGSMREFYMARLLKCSQATFEIIFAITKNIGNQRKNQVKP